jgi:phosphomevalonate kinase
MTGTLTVRAPGKVMLSGEYAVLDGAVAAVMAVDRYAIGRATTGEDASLEGWETVELRDALAVAREQGVLRGDVFARVSPGTLFDGAQKLGLGSSAAMCVAGLGAALAREGVDLDGAREVLARVALEGHRRAQGGGSGVDVYASAYGGVFATMIEGGRARDPEPLAWPEGADWRVLWTGDPVSTKDFVARVRGLRARDPSAYEDGMGRVRAASEAFVSAMRVGDARALVRATDAHGRAMDALGQGAGVAIVTEPMRILRDAGVAGGWAVKPSGAGGGDIVLVVGERERGFAGLDAACEGLGLRVLAMGVSPIGAHVIK